MQQGGKPPPVKDLLLVVLVTVGFTLGIISGYYFPPNTYTAREIAHQHLVEHHRALGSEAQIVYDPRVVSSAPIIHPPPAKSHPKLANVQLHEFPSLTAQGTKPVFVKGKVPQPPPARKQPAVEGTKAIPTAPPPKNGSKPSFPPIGTPTSHLEVLKHQQAKYAGDTIHTLFTSNGSPYQNIQARIMYASYKLAQKMPGGEKLTGFTRILHRTKPDEMMELGELPSYRADPIQASCDNWCEFPVSDRANAVRQWLEAAEKQPDMVQGAWLLLLESDYVWMKPLQALGSAYDDTVRGLAFHFDYINPQYPTVIPVMKEMCPECDVNAIPGSGPAPVLLRFGDLKKVTPDWERYSQWIEDHAKAKEDLGWVREMYAWSVGVAKNQVNLLTEAPPKSALISQLPHDQTLGNACMFHYTWGVLYHSVATNKEVWKFDKRFYTDFKFQMQVPEMEMPPKFEKGKIKLLDGLPVDENLSHAVEQLITQINKSVGTLRDLTKVPPPAKT